MSKAATAVFWLSKLTETAPEDPVFVVKFSVARGKSAEPTVCG